MSEPITPEGVGLPTPPADPMSLGCCGDWMMGICTGCPVFIPLLNGHKL